jgi:hypothetical protein
VPAGELDFEALFAVLAKHEVRFVVIGAFAALMHGWNGATEDVDITPDRDVRNLVRLAAALRELEAVVKRPDGSLDPEAPIDDQRLRMQDRWLFETKHGDLDVVLNPAGFAGYGTLVTEATIEQVGEVAVAIASLEAVIRSKEAAGRPKDLAVVPVLRRLRDEQQRGTT